MDIIYENVKCKCRPYENFFKYNDGRIPESEYDTVVEIPNSDI